MKVSTKLSVILSALATETSKAMARLQWQMMYNPGRGYTTIRHRSPNKKRILARRRGF